MLRSTCFCAGRWILLLPVRGVYPLVIQQGSGTTLCHPSQYGSASQQLLWWGWRRLVTEYSHWRMQICSSGNSECCSGRKRSQNAIYQCSLIGQSYKCFLRGGLSLKKLSSKVSHIWWSGQILGALAPCLNGCVVQVSAVMFEWWPDETAAPHQLSCCPELLTVGCLREASCGSVCNLCGCKVTRIWLAQLFSASRVIWELSDQDLAI